MIEVEKKFVYKEEIVDRLLEGAEFVSEKIFTDSYYDDNLYSLTSKDVWFRKRDNNFELKLPLNESIDKRISDQYRELETDKEIADYLGWDLSGTTLEEVLTTKWFKPFATYTTARKKYKNGNFTIDVDTTDFGFNIVEIELMTEEGSGIQEAIQKILKFAQVIGLEVGYVRGKVIEYIQRKDRKHFNKLVESGVVK